MSESNKILRTLAYIRKPLGFLLKAIKLCCLDIFTSEGRVRLDGACRLLGYYPGSVKPLLETVPYEKVFKDNLELRLLETGFVSGNVLPHELLLICYLVKKTNPATIFEIGTFDGRTTLNMAVKSSEETELFTLDLPAEQAESTVFEVEAGEKGFIKKRRSGVRFENHSYSDRIVQLYGDSAVFDFSPYAGKIDFVFIDGSHSYEYVLNDSRKAFGMLSDRGVVVWHDYGWWEGVTRALNEIKEEYPEIGMIHVENTTLVVGLKGTSDGPDAFLT